MKSFPLNIEVRHTQTFDAAEPPSDRTSGAISLEMRQSIVLLPKQPMRPRYADRRVGFMSIERVNYGLDEQKAATQAFIRRWRLEPADPSGRCRRARTFRPCPTTCHPSSTPRPPPGCAV